MPKLAAAAETGTPPRGSCQETHPYQRHILGVLLLHTGKVGVQRGPPPLAAAKGGPAAHPRRRCRRPILAAALGRGTLPLCRHPQSKDLRTGAPTCMHVMRRMQADSIGTAHEHAITHCTQAPTDLASTSRAPPTHPPAAHPGWAAAPAPSSCPRSCPAHAASTRPHPGVRFKRPPGNCGCKALAWPGGTVSTGGRRGGSGSTHDQHVNRTLLTLWLMRADATTVEAHRGASAALRPMAEGESADSALVAPRHIDSRDRSIGRGCPVRGDLCRPGQQYRRVWKRGNWWVWRCSLCTRYHRQSVRPCRESLRASCICRSRNEQRPRPLTA